MFFISTVLFFSICHCLAINDTTQGLNEDGSDVFKMFSNHTHYNKWAMPFTPGEPLEVKVRAYIYHLKAKQTAKLDIVAHILLELLWEDNRLKYKEQFPDLSMIKGDKVHLRNIWTPHLFFSNEKASVMIGKTSEHDFMTILPSGSVILTTRMKASMQCLLQLEDFPFDQQRCLLSINSWRYSSKALHLVWDKDIPLQLERLKNGLEEFDILLVKNISSLEDIPHTEDEDLNFSSLTILLQLRRHYGYYFINYYLPSVLLVITSWVAFWYEPAAISAGRVTIGISTMLTFISLCWSGQGEQKGSQFMATDIWTVTCTAFIILSLVESAFVNTIDRKGKGEKVQIKKPSSKHIFQGGVNYAAGRAKLRRSSSCPSSPEIRRHFAQQQTDRIMELKDLSLSLDKVTLKRKMEQKRGSHLKVFTMTPQEIAKWIDVKCRIIFPVAFLVFNVIYWLPLFIVKG